MSDYHIDEHSVKDTDVIGAWVIFALCLVALVTPFFF